MIITTYFSDGWTPKTGLSPIIKIYNITDSTLEINWGAMTEVWSGLYKYDFTWYTNTKDYAFRADWGTVLSDSDRYTTGGNEDFSFSTLNVIPEAFDPWTVWYNIDKRISQTPKAGTIFPHDIWWFKYKNKTILEMLDLILNKKEEKKEEKDFVEDFVKIQEIENKIDKLTQIISEKQSEINTLDIKTQVIEAIDERQENKQISKKKEELKKLLLERQKESIVEMEKEKQELLDKKEELKKLLIERQKEIIESEDEEEEENIEDKKERLKKELLQRQKNLLNNL